MIYTQVCYPGAQCVCVLPHMLCWQLPAGAVVYTSRALPLSTPSLPPCTPCTCHLCPCILTFIAPPSPPPPPSTPSPPFPCPCNLILTRR
jgi:hypothetical protein